jgi:predicted nucleic acid-binding protein
MPLNSNIIISDTSCLILLIKIDELDLLRTFSDRIIITSIIKKELGIALPDWIEVIDPKDIHYQKILEMDLDQGEASAISLMLEIDNSVLLIDDLKGRKIAERLNLRFSGTFGLLLKSKEIGLIKSIKPLIEKVRSTNFRFSEKLLSEVLKQAKE